MNINKNTIIECLESIGWSVRSHGANYLFIYNYKGENTHWVVFSDRIFLDDFIGDFDRTPSCAFYFDECELAWVGDEKTTFSLVPKKSEHNGVYLMFSNHDLKRERKESR